MKPIIKSALIAAALTAPSVTLGATVYNAGVAPTNSDLVFGTHLIGGPHTSVAGVGGGGLSAAGSVLDGSRTYIYDQGAQADLTDGVAKRGESPFAMMIWDMGAAYDSMRLYTHQDHFSGGPVTTNFVGQDLMEYSVWGSNNGDDFVLLSDVTGFNLNGGGAGLPTYTFAGTAPTIVYRGGSQEFGIVNAYTREYVFADAYQYYGVRTSQVSLTIPGGGVDADPELDAIAAFNTVDRCETNPNDPSCVDDGGGTPVSEPSMPALFGLILSIVGVTARLRARK